MEICLDLRLRSIVDLVSEDKNVVDVGTDHGYIPIYLALYKKCKNIIACDINQKPLETARKNISKYNLLKKIDLILSNGLKNIESYQVDEIIIAGMGGELIVEIIKDCSFINKKTLLLQPMSKSEYLREYLYNLNFEILKEIPIFYNQKYYSIILAKHCKKMSYKKDSVYINLGKIINCENEFKKDYIMYKYNNIKTISQDMKNSNSNSTKEKFKHLEKTLSEISKYL